MESCITHRLKEWREHNPIDMLHLGNGARVRMGRSLVNYFKALDRIPLCLVKSKNEGLALVKAETNQQ